MNGEGIEERRSIFIGRVQEQRQFKVALQGLLAHHRRWREWAEQVGDAFDPADALGDDSYARIFILHGIGGIGKTRLTERCLELARESEADPAVLTISIDLSRGLPVQQPTHLMDRLYNRLAEMGYAEELSPYRQAQAEAPKVVERVARYRAENRERWNALVQTAAALIAKGAGAVGRAYGLPLDGTATAFLQTAIVSTVAV